jgi:hypothetical protein
MTSMPCRDSSTWTYTALAVSPAQRFRVVAAGRYRNCNTGVQREEREVSGAVGIAMSYYTAGEK